VADQQNTNPTLGCLWLVALVLFLPAGIVAAAIWPNQTANQFVGRTLLIGGGFAVAVVAVGVTLALSRQRR
jgi:uncharacterized membrane protein